MATRVNRVGETVQANCGMMMTIIAYRNSNDIDVQFENGTVVRNRDYWSFKKGSIGNRKNEELMVSRVGETRMMNCGKEATIISYRKSDDIDVSFSDGTIVKNRMYQSFVKGKIAYPTERANHVGEERRMNNGQLAIIENWRYNYDIDVRFEDGTFVANKSYKSFKEGSIRNPNCYVGLCSLQESIFLFYLRNLGFKKAVSGYLKKYDISWGNKELDMFNEEFKVGVEYDGFFWHKNKTDIDFLKDLLCYNSGIQLFRIRETDYKGNRLASLGSSSHEIFVNPSIIEDMEMAIIEIVRYINQNFNKSFCLDVDINRDIDTIRQFHYQNKNHQTHKRIGETNVSLLGQKMIIIEYFSSDNITVQFDDGTIVKNQSYWLFKKKQIRNPNRYSFRVGEVHLANNGLKMTIIEYLNSRQATVCFEDGVIVNNLQYGNIVRGQVVHPMYKNRKTA